MTATTLLTTEDQWPNDAGGRTWIESPPAHPTTNKPEGTDGFDGITVAVSRDGGVCVLAGDDGERRTLSILNTTPGTSIVIGRRTQVTSGAGFLLPSGTLLPMTTYREVCAWVPPGSDATVRVVSVLTERNKT